jgi:TetR/AcrR family transcriptional regulator
MATQLPGVHGSQLSITRIRDAAEAEFIKHGLDASRLDEIAKSAGVSVQLIYHYYGHKEDLYREVLASLAEKSIQFIRERPLDDMDPWDAMEYIVRGIFGENNKHLGRMIADQVIHRGAQISRSNRIDLHHQELIDAIESVLERGQKGGEFSADLKPNDVFVAIVSLSVGYLNLNEFLPASRTATGAKSQAEWEEFACTFIRNALFA